MPFTIPNETAAAFTPQARLFSADIDALVAGYVRTGVVSGCVVTAQGVPDMTVAVAGGTVEVNGVVATVAAGNVTITAADATNPRFDLIVSSNAGVKSAVAGTPAASPLLPAIPANSVPLAAVYVPAGDTAINANQITDKRVMLDTVWSKSGAFLIPDSRIYRRNDGGSYVERRAEISLVADHAAPTGLWPAMYVAAKGKGNNTTFIGVAGLTLQVMDRTDVYRLEVTGATNATPIVITTSVAHGLSTGAQTGISGVGGNTAANGLWTITVIDATSFSLDGSVGNGAYTSGGVASNRGVLYGLQVIMEPKVGRNYVPYDDVGGVVVQNDGTGKGTDALYIGRGKNITGSEWVTLLTADGFADYGIRLNGTITNFGLDFNSGSQALGAIRLKNNTGIVGRNAANSANVDLLKINTSDELQLHSSAFLTGTRPAVRLVHTGSPQPARVAQYASGSSHFTMNAYFDGSGWMLDDVNTAGVVVSYAATNPFLVRYATAGVNPRSLATYLSIDANGRLNLPAAGANAGLSITGTYFRLGTTSTAGQVLTATDATGIGTYQAMAFTRGGSLLNPTGATNVVVWRAPFAGTGTAIRVYRKGGTGATVNARKNGTLNLLAADLSAVTADAWDSSTTLQNASFAVGDTLEIMLVTVAGSPTEVAILVDLSRP